MLTATLGLALKFTPAPWLCLEELQCPAGEQSAFEAQEPQTGQASSSDHSGVSPPAGQPWCPWSMPAPPPASVSLQSQVSPT